MSIHRPDRGAVSPIYKPHIAYSTGSTFTITRTFSIDEKHEDEATMADCELPYIAQKIRNIHASTALSVLILCTGIIGIQKNMSATPKNRIAAQHTPDHLRSSPAYTTQEIQNILNVQVEEDRQHRPIPVMKALDTTPSFLRDTPFPNLHPINSLSPSRLR